MFKKIIKFFTGGKSEENVTAFEQNVEEQAAPLAPKSNAGDDDLTEED